MKYNRYSVPPFSQTGGPTFGKSANNDDTLPCAICKRPVKNPKHWAVVTDAGDRWGDAKDAVMACSGNPGYMGEFPIGSDCHKRFFLDSFEVISNA